MAEQHGIPPVELAAIPGTGSGGRVTKKDFLSYLETRSSNSMAAAPRQAKTNIPEPVSDRNYGEDGITVQPMDRMRQLIADHMVRSKQTSPHVYSVAEVDVTNVALARKKHQAAFVAREGFKLSFTPFFLLAAVKGIIQYPQINSSVDGTNIILKKDINLGVAVALGTTGLIVPVIKKADHLSLAGIARQLKDLAERARNKKLKPDETQGGTFTVTNPGVFGNIIGCPIINQPQVAILATCAIKKRPVVVDDMIAIRSMMNITLSYDHRVIDGSLSGHFLHYVTQYIENWDPEDEIL
jgi:2-oxoglutarate dehydrogenase E2 component (dihydrolipoamide succinyltransferase)